MSYMHFDEARAKFEGEMKEEGLFRSSNEKTTVLSPATLRDFAEDRLEECDLFPHVKRYGRDEEGSLIIQWVRCPQNWEDINLDCMSEKALMTFWSDYKDASEHQLEAFFEGASESVFSQAEPTLATLCSYAVAKSCSIKLRLEGNIEGALVYEIHCEGYYADLPEEVRW